MMKRLRAAVGLIAIGLAAGCGAEGGGSGLGIFSGMLGGGLDQDTIVAGLKQALEVGSQRAVQQLSVPGGYGRDPSLRIGLPGRLDDVAGTLRAMGWGGERAMFEAKMNQAAEQAASQAGPVFLDAIRQMTIADARRILKGSDTAATEYFRATTTDRLMELYAPIVDHHLNQVGALAAGNELMGRYNAIPLVPKADFTPRQYVTGKALDGLFDVLGAAEADIRANPAARTTELLQRVFAAP